MASDISTYLGNKILRWLAGNAMPSPPAGIFLALYDGDPKAAGTEITENIRYDGRLAITLDAIASGVDNQVVNVGAVNFGASESAVSLSHVAVYDDGGAGNLLWSKALVGGPFAIVIGTLVSFADGELTFTVGS